MADQLSQVDVTKTVEAYAGTIPGEGLSFVKNAAEKVHTGFTLRPYNDQTKGDEAAIRWRRTATQIIQDGYIYEGKSCTDEVITLIAVCKARGYDARFVKLVYPTPEGTYTHSVAEVKLPDGWYMVDVNGSWGERKGEIMPNEHIQGYRLWKKGRDAWDVGLEDFSSQSKLL